MIRENLAAIHQRIEAACARKGRAPSEVTLLAVSKLQPSSMIREAYEAGQRDFGENYAQELRDKAEELAALYVRWHAIGPLQTNKAKYVAKVATSFHALDRAEIAEALGKKRSTPLDCYLEINVAGEESKSGVAPEAAPALLDAVSKIENIRVVGLMCMPPMEEPEHARPHFRALRELARKLGLPGLSMGTTDDFEIAIEEGATLVRVGRSIFGARPARH
ncbi:MAG: YggS family pyridoxal phosphate-dependent enzyme [Polyangiales bacterium]